MPDGNNILASNGELGSKLLSLIFQQLQDRPHLTVLDLGCATPETVDFFAQFRCKLFFVDLLSEPLVVAAESDQDKDTPAPDFGDVMNFPPGTHFDICLFWDCLHYLDDASLKAFSAALQPYVSRNTRGHGIGVMNTNTTIGNFNYGIQNLEKLNARLRRESQLPCNPHPPAALKKLVSCFNIDKSLLLVDGRLELLLKGVETGGQQEKKFFIDT